MVARTYNFDEIIERRGTDSAKWSTFEPDVIPMWVADMDFRSPPAVLEALHERIEHGVFGYGYAAWHHAPDELIAVLQTRYAERHDLSLEHDDILIVPSVISTLYGLVKLICKPGEQVLLQRPIYWPFVSAAEAAPREIVFVPMVTTIENGIIRYEVDFDAFEAAITPQTRLFILSNPHNPVGRVYERWELERMAEICLRHNILICSDEIHAELTYPGHKHIPFPSLGPEVAERSIIVTAASKAFNLPGIGMGIAISKNHDLLNEVSGYFRGLGLGGINVMSSTAVLAAFRDGQPWLDDLLVYLRENRDYALDFVRENMPGILPTLPEATCLMLLHCDGSAIDGDPCDFFRDEARVALSGNFGSQGYPQITRLNFGCPRSRLTDALERMAAALTEKA